MGVVIPFITSTKHTMVSRPRSGRSPARSPRSKSPAAVKQAKEADTRDVFRGVPVKDLVQAGCGLLANAAGSTETYSLSRPVEGNLGTFISHSWRSNALHKYLTILYHASMQRAFAIGHAAAFVAFLIGLFVRFVLRWRLLIICHWVIPGGAGFHPGVRRGGCRRVGRLYANADLPHVMPMTFLSGVAMSVGMNHDLRALRVQSSACALYVLRIFGRYNI